MQPEQISLRKYVDRMKEGQNDIYYITMRNCASLLFSFLESLHKKGPEVLYMSDIKDDNKSTDERHRRIRLRKSRRPPQTQKGLTFETCWTLSKQSQKMRS